MTPTSSRMTTGTVAVLRAGRPSLSVVNRSAVALPSPVPDPLVTVVIPAKDEEGLIGEMVDAVQPYAHQVLVVDGQSRDRTRELALAHGARVIVDNGRGKGAAMRLAIKEARSEILVFFDADGSHEPADIPALVGPIEAGDADLVIGSRGRGGSDELHGALAELIRYVGSQLIMLAINYRWGVHLTDSQNGFRAIRRDVALRLGLTSNVATIEQEMLMKALHNGFRVQEIPSHEYERRWGKSKIIVWKLWFHFGWSLLVNLF